MQSVLNKSVGLGLQPSLCTVYSVVEVSCVQTHLWLRLCCAGVEVLAPGTCTAATRSIYVTYQRKEERLVEVFSMGICYLLS